MDHSIIEPIDFGVGEARPQARLQERSFHEWKDPNRETVWMSFHRTGSDGYLLRFPGLADFDVSLDGDRIFCRPAPEVSEATIQHLYLNQVLPLALSKRGKLVFHAGAVEIGGEGVAFVGESGRGKSTLTASFATCGFRFLTDDGLVVEPWEGGYRIMPSHPSIRLWQDSEAALVGEHIQKAPPLEFTSKARFLAGESIGYCEQPRRLRRVYFLGDGRVQEPTFQPMAPVETLMELIEHSFLLDIAERNMLSIHFDGLSCLAGQPIFFRLDYPRNFERLPQVRRSILKHAFEEGG